MAKPSETKTPAEQEAEERAKSAKPRKAADEVAEVPAATSEATEGAPRESSATGANQKYTQAFLRKNSYKLVGVAPWIVTGALDGVDDEELTVARVKGLVEKFTDRSGGN